jgi:hypothetical protein
MSFESELAALNEWHFFEEFVYSTTTFRPQPHQEVELADNLVWLGSVHMAFQLKERDTGDGATPESERRWFEKKVLGVATKQIRDTVTYLEKNESIQLKNGRGHSFELKSSEIEKLHKLVAYLPHAELPVECRLIKHHESATAGFIHVISGHDYLGIVRTLLTPAEVADYLSFRELLVGRYPIETLTLPEAALVGQYLTGDYAASPSSAFLEDLHALEHRAEEWDMSGIIKRFTERTTSSSGPTDYYQIVRELALLKRNELKEIKVRYQLALKKARANEFAQPYRLAVPRTGCGFIFIPLMKDQIANRQIGLTNLTLAHKYDQHLDKCIGVTIADDEGPWFLADWCFADFPWERDEDIEKHLKEVYPFREVRQAELPGYSFSESMQ